ncbi:chelonianin-like [Python bivittatus]|uniref:Chelonianin-like n=1 Tax=Python bivittatus TaxID=176946 RepID=A0A9F5N5P2_PYTBI|nr:chelonianin-like [Python bivittatus]
MEPSGLLLLLVSFLPMGSALFPIPLPFAPAKIRVDICRLPPATGSCLALFERWYYNPKVRRCLTFTYGGCGGNPNNFRTRRSCELACSPSPPGKPGTCPSPTAHLDKTCGQFCSTDASCPGSQRCCGTSCGQKCQLPVGGRAPALASDARVPPAPGPRVLCSGQAGHP